jgi:hypothetical protein
MKRIQIVAALLACMSSIASAQQGVGYIAINGVRNAKCERIFSSRDVEYSTLEPLADYIENIEVVKGAAAVKLYGPDAVQGAILITLKKGATLPATVCDRPNASAPAATDPIARYLYPPELVIAHQEAIGLTAQQRVAIQTNAALAGAKNIESQRKLSAAGDKLAAMLAKSVVDEASVLDQIDQVLAVEREVKRAQLVMLVQVKNQLTPAQQEKLDRLK